VRQCHRVQTSIVKQVWIVIWTWYFTNNNIYIDPRSIPIRLAKFERNFTKCSFYFVMQFMSKRKSYLETGVDVSIRYSFYKWLSPPCTITIEYILKSRRYLGWECEGVANIVLVGRQLALLTHTPLLRPDSLGHKSNPVPRCARGHNSCHTHMLTCTTSQIPHKNYCSASTCIFLVIYMYI